MVPEDPPPLPSPVQDFSRFSRNAQSTKSRYRAPNRATGLRPGGEVALGACQARAGRRTVEGRWLSAHVRRGLVEGQSKDSRRTVAVGAHRQQRGVRGGECSRIRSLEVTAFWQTSPLRDQGVPPRDADVAAARRHRCRIDRVRRRRERRHRSRIDGTETQTPRPGWI